jgi:hypothetical protein
MKKILLTALASVVVSGCAASIPEGAVTAGEPNFPTGSNIVRRDKSAGPKVEQMSREEFQRNRMEVSEPTPKN